MNIRSFKKFINNLSAGETFYFNSIGGSVSCIEYLRDLIKEGKVAPVKEELSKMIVPEAFPKFFSGESICPQMVYIVK